MDLPPNTLCAKCFKALSAKSIACHVCRAKYHFFCADIDANIAELFIKNANLVFNCNDCLRLTSNLIAGISSLKTEVRELKLLIDSSLRAEVHELKQIIENNKQTEKKQRHQHNSNLNTAAVRSRDVVGKVQSTNAPVAAAVEHSLNVNNSQHVVPYASSVSSLNTVDANAVDNDDAVFEANVLPNSNWVRVQRRRKRKDKVIYGENNTTNELDVVISKKWVHISSFKPSVTSEHITDFIQKNANIAKSNMECYVLVKKDVDINSLKRVNFKLGVTSNHYDDVINPNGIASPLINEVHGLKIYYHNLSGMRTKSKDVFDFSNQLNYDVIALVETWLNDDFCDAEFFDLNLFAVYRKDRNVSRTGYSRGGGVLLAVKSQYKSNLCGLDDDSGLLDQIAVCINGLNLSVVLCLSYIPPGSSASIYSKHIDNIFAIEVSMGSKANICVMGDFNLPNICWSKFDDNHFLTPTNVNKDYEVNCIDTLLSLNLVQINHFSNQLHRFLDLIFVPNDFKFNVYECLAPISPSNLHHMPIVVEVGYFNFLKSSPSQNLALNYNVCDFNMLNSILGSIDWIKIFNDKTSSVCYDFFIEKVSDILKSNVPFKKNKPHKLPWYTTGLKKLKNLRNKFHKRFLAHGDPEDLVQCKHYQREFNFLNKFLYKQYILDKENEIKANPKSFWSYVNSKRKTSDIPSTLTYNGCTSKSGVDVVNMFASFFKSNFDSPVTSSAAVLDSVSAINLANISVSDEDVLDAIFNIKNSFKHDADGLCAYFLKKCSICVAPILTFIFNLSIKEGIFINRWKVASITPVFKGGRKDDHGFFSGRSTSTNLVLFTEYCLSAFERGCQVEAIYTDLSKAFDKVSHSILLDKLQELGFHSNFLSWIASYLHNRVCTVKVESFVSSPYIQTSGVPQGSILGPLLFILFINGISSCFSTSRFLLYADDLKIFHKIESMSDVFDLQNDLDNLLSWCISNKLLINLSKCAHVSFYRLRHPIQTSFKIVCKDMNSIDYNNK
ncbi:uncharacterized protein LOC131997968 [Stomoxys calcitrans]|uniref:uncharacterized protein LOC131997968 n=1 Tax=Stomoxys calcitrans TaxID=35570 RepID=UPI0027E28F31|nr:uncharacterized protein LOC131997968 [Stomoxys calcitrans]